MGHRWEFGLCPPSGKARRDSVSPPGGYNRGRSQVARPETMRTTTERVLICGWLTDVLSIDNDSYVDASKPHTLLLLIPGNPGVIHWYIDFLENTLQNLGDGYAVRGVSYAGHGVGDNVIGSDEDHNICSNSQDDRKRQEKMNIAWTMDGQGTVDRNFVRFLKDQVVEHLA